MIDSSERLRLHEEILLLTLRDKEGTFHWKSYLPALAGGVMAELLLAHRIEVEERRTKLVNLVDPEPIGDPLLDETLKKLSDARRRASLQSWVQRIAGLKDLQHRVATPLCRRGILREDEGTVLLFFHRKIYPEVDPRPEREIIDKIRRAIFSDDRNLDPRTVVLISLASCANLLAIPFEKWQLKERKARIKSIRNGQLIGDATHEAIEATHAAVMVAAVLPAVITATRVGR